VQLNILTRCGLCIRVSNVSCYFLHIDHKCDNFIVGLTNVSPNISTPTLYNYTLCGQYPGAVPAAATVSLYCQDNLPPFRYVIVQRPLTGYYFVPCEIEVLVRGMRISNTNILIFSTQVDSFSTLLFAYFSRLADTFQPF